MDKSVDEQKLKQYEEQWNRAGLEDNFVFFKVMQDKELCLGLLRRIFPNLNIVKIMDPDQEKVIASAKDSKSVRMDLLVREINDSGEETRVFNLEMQVVSNSVLPKRSRYYQSMLDIDILERGEDYNKLIPSYVVFICVTDMFTDNRVKYTFKNMCEENYQELGDEREIIFLNASGEFGEVSDELQNFLNYVRDKLTNDEFTRKLSESVNAVKLDSETKGEYIKMITERSFWKEEGREEGIKKGIKKGMEKAIIELVISGDLTPEKGASKLGISTEEMKEKVEKNLQTV